MVQRGKLLLSVDVMKMAQALLIMSQRGAPD